jgi:hypothetical protein
LWLGKSKPVRNLKNTGVFAIRFFQRIQIHTGRQM